MCVLRREIHRINKFTPNFRRCGGGRVIERLARQLDVVARVVLVDVHVKRIVPRVEDTEVVVRRNASDQAVDDQRRAVPLSSGIA